MRKLLFTLLALCIIPVGVYAGCSTPGLTYGHILGGWLPWADFDTAQSNQHVFAYGIGGTTGMVNTANAGCSVIGYDQQICQYGNWAYIGNVAFGCPAQFDFGAYTACTTLTACPPATADAVVAYYIVPSEGTANHGLKWVVDSCGVDAGIGWDMDDSNGSGANPAMATLGVIGISAVTRDATNIYVTVNIPVPGGIYGENTGIIGSPTAKIAGFQVLYQQVGAAPTSGLASGWTAPADLDSRILFGGAGNGSDSAEITIPFAGTNDIYLTYVPVFANTTTCATLPCTTTAQVGTLYGNGFFLPYTGPNSAPITPTPVTITSFNGVYQDLQTIDLNWITASEMDAAGFFLYRSLDGLNWTQVNTQLIPAAGQGGSGANYAFTDNLPKQRTFQKWYYKVEELTTNGQRAATANTTVSR
ncbi:MAG TPA: hypothetical protein PK014_00025 [Thermoanaerobaculia bacterium]|nr:hypothetical protein [Thermoanaerobaculia bacterium]HXK69100.1 hypothetical protein [Thermoanaerobaculia bacterium]